MKRITIFLVVLAYYTICYSQSVREDSLKIALSYFDSGQYEKAAVSFFQLGQYKKAIKCLEIYSIETKFEPDEVLVEKYRKCNELLDGGQRAKSLDEKWINYLQLEELNPDDPTVIAEKEKAEKGNGDDLYSIGRYYENVKKDNGQAIIWYKKAIDRGNEKAKGKLLKMEPQSSDSGSMCSNTDSTGKLSTQLHLETNNASGYSDDGRNTKSVFDPSRCDNYVQKTIGYKYSKDFPFAISYIYSFEDLFDHFVYGGFEVGVNLDNKGYVRYALDMKSGDKIETTKIYNPLLYSMLSSGYNLRVVSLHLGYGCVFYEKQLIAKNYYRIERPITTTTTIITQVSVNGNNQTNIDSFQDTEVELKDVVSLNKKNMLGVSLILQPSISFNLPIDDDRYYASFNIGYNFVPRIKELNGISCGLSFSW